MRVDLQGNLQAQMHLEIKRVDRTELYKRRRECNIFLLYSVIARH